MEFLRNVASIFSSTPRQRVSLDVGANDPFLSDEELPTAKVETVAGNRKKRTNQLCGRFFTVFPWVLSTILFICLVRRADRSDCISYYDLTFGSNEKFTYSPVQHLIEPKNVVFTSGFEPHLSVYQGPSTPERDQAWEDLYSFGMSRIPKSSAAKLVNKTITIPGDPDHSVIMLKVFHQLHCLNKLRLRLWSNGTVDPNDFNLAMDHASHCIDSLRQAVMCAVDITPIPWRWFPDRGESQPYSSIQHTCRNFEQVREWAKENHLKSFDKTVPVVDES